MLKRYNKQLALILFLLQLVALLYLIFSNQKVVNQGKVYKLECRPVDPADPFRGRYVRLSYPITRFITEDTTSFVQGQKVYCTLITGADGFAIIDQVMKDRPQDRDDYFIASIRSSSLVDSSQRLSISIPIDKYFMNEFTAPEAERAYNEALQAEIITYVTVSVWKGKVIINQLFIDGQAIERFLEEKVSR